MISLIYLSSAVREMTEEELLEILEQSERNNEKVGITGILLYREGNFLQVLEGEPEAVHALYDKICKDSRHRGILKISERPITERDFGAWQMGFVNLETINPDDVPGFSDYLLTPLTEDSFGSDPTFAQVFVQSFKEMGR